MARLADGAGAIIGAGDARDAAEFVAGRQQVRVRLARAAPQDYNPVQALAARGLININQCVTDFYCICTRRRTAAADTKVSRLPLLTLGVR